MLPLDTTPNAVSNVIPDLLPARLSASLRAGVGAVWDNLGLCIAVSITFLIALSLPLVLVRGLPASIALLPRLGITALCALLVLSLPIGGAFGLAHRIATHDEAGYSEFVADARRLWPISLRLCLLQSLVLAGCGLNLWFYLSLHNLPGLLAALLTLYLLLFWGLMSVTHFPVLVAQEAGVFDTSEHRAHRGVLPVLRRSFFLAVGNPLFCLGLLLFALLLTGAMLATGVLFGLLWLPTFALLLTLPTRALFVRYGVLPTPDVEPIVPDEKFRLPEKTI